MRNGVASNERNANLRLVVLGYILAVSIPPLGVIFGIALILRSPRQSLHGVAVIVLSVVTAIVWVGLLTSGAFNTPTTNY